MSSSSGRFMKMYVIKIDRLTDNVVGSKKTSTVAMRSVGDGFETALPI